MGSGFAKKICPVLGLGLLVTIPYRTLAFCGPLPQQLQTLETEIGRLVKKVRPLVVSIIAYSEESSPLLKEDQEVATEGDGMAPARRIIYKNIGSGFILSSDGYIVTKGSFLEQADKIEVILSDGRSFSAQIVGIDAYSTIAVVKIEAKNLPKPRFAKTARLGSWVMVMGGSIGMAPTCTFGMIKGVTQDGLLHLSANITPGSIGGAVFNMEGEIVGMVAARISPQGAGTYGEGIAYSGSLLKRDTERLLILSQRSRGWLGVTACKTESPVHGKGLKVLHVFKGAPAYIYGIKEGDIILRIDGHPIGGIGDLLNRLEELLPGTEVDFLIARGNQTFLKRIRIGEKPWPGLFEPAWEGSRSTLWPSPISRTHSSFSRSLQTRSMQSRPSREPLERRIERMEREIQRLKKMLREH